MARVWLNAHPSDDVVINKGSRIRFIIVLLQGEDNTAVVVESMTSCYFSGHGRTIQHSSATVVEKASIILLLQWAREDNTAVLR